MAKPTIAEIIAAKKAAANKDATSLSSLAQSLAGQSIMPVETMAAMIDAKAVIDRIDPPSAGKQRAGLVLSASTPLPPADIAQKAHHAELRNLSRTSGEGIDMTPAAADKETATWHAALNGFESDLVVMRDPESPETCWLAVRPLRPGLPPILLHRLPWTIWEHPQTIRPEDIPY